MIRTWIFRILAFVVSVAIFISCLFVADHLVVKYRKELGLDRNHTRLNLIWSNVPRGEANEAIDGSGRLAELIRERRAKNNAINGNNKSRQEMVSETLKKDYSKIRRFRAFSDQNELVYDVEYEFDSFGRRTVNQKQVNGDTAIVFLGCSYTFGEGIPNEGTIPQYLVHEGINAEVYNLGIRGGSAATFLRQFDEKPEFYTIRKRKIILVYGFQHDHLEREHCGWFCYFQNSFHSKKPRYILQGEDLVYSGTHEEYYSAPLLRKLLENFNSVKKGLLYKGAEDDDDSYKLHFRLLEEIKRKLSQSFEIVDSYEFFLRDSSLTLYEKMKAMNSTEFKQIYVPFSEVMKRNGGIPADLAIKGDGHPTEVANYIAAKAIIKVLRKDHPGLFESSKH